MLDRAGHLRPIEQLLRRYPVVAILGAHQVGKTTLARAVTSRRHGVSTHFDLEDPVALSRIARDVTPLA